jgi:hypothetical protein
MHCPAELPGVEDGYDLAPEMPKTVPAPAVKPVQVLPYRGQASGNPSAPEPETIMNFYAPLWLLGGGIVVEIIANSLLRTRGFVDALVHVGIELIGGTIVMLIGVWIAAFVRNVKLGPLPIAIFKLSAIYIAPIALGDLLMPLAWMIPFGGIGVFIGVFVFYFALLGMFFDLQQEDTWYFVLVIWIVSIGVFFLLRQWNI